MGQFSGAGSIMHHLTGFSGQRKPLFSQAILISPTWDISPETNKTRYYLGSGLHQFTGLDEDLNEVDSRVLQELNQKIVSEFPRGRYTIGPRTDDSFVSSQPLALLRRGLAHDNDKESIKVSRPSHDMH